jgi:hypothetical protein
VVISNWHCSLALYLCIFHNLTCVRASFFAKHYPSIPLYHVSCVYSSVDGHELVSSSELLWRMHLRTFVCKIIWVHIFSFLWGKYLGVEGQGHTVTMLIILKNCQTIFQNGPSISHCHQQCPRVLILIRDILNLWIHLMS